MDFLVHHFLETSQARTPDKEAVVCGDVRLTYAELWRQVRALSDRLRVLGVERGDRVGIFVERSHVQAVAIFAIARAGGVFVPINEVLFPDQVSHIAQDCAMKCIIVSATKVAHIREVLETTRLDTVIVSGDGDRAGLDADVHAYDDLISGDPSEPWKELSIGGDLAALIYTSGSTGRAKGVMLSHTQIRAGSTIVSSYLEIDHEHRTLAALPFSFDAGLNQLMTAMEHGATVVIQPFVFARELVETLLAEKITGMGGVPPLWALMAQTSSSLHKHDYPELRYISNTGGAMPQPVLRTLRERLRSTRVYLMYGLTEAFRSTYLPPEELDRRPTSMGKAIPNTEILVVREDGSSCDPGEVGELVHRGPTVSMGYWGQPDLTAKSIRPHPQLPAELGDAERVVYSGDLVKTDDDGFLYFVARRDQMIKSSGFRVSPTEVESVLFRSSSLREAAVIGIPDDMTGQAIKAFVVARDGEAVDDAELIGYCAEHMPRHMVPKSVEILDSLPKTGSGKIDYPALRKREGLDH